MYKIQCISKILYVIVINPYGVNVKHFSVVILSTSFDSYKGNWIIPNTRSITYLWFTGAYLRNQCLVDMSNREWLHCSLFVKLVVIWARYDILCLVCFFFLFELLQNIFKYFENWITPFSINWVILTKIASPLVCINVTMTTFLTWDLIGSIFQHN